MKEIKKSRKEKLLEQAGFSLHYITNGSPIQDDEKLNKRFPIAKEGHYVILRLNHHSTIFYKTVNGGLEYNRRDIKQMTKSQRRTK